MNRQESMLCFCIGAALVLSAPRFAKNPWLTAIVASAGGVQIHVALSQHSILRRQRDARAQSQRDTVAVHDAEDLDELPVVAFDSATPVH